jgi:hypothetical protein
MKLLLLVFMLVGCKQILVVASDEVFPSRFPNGTKVDYKGRSEIDGKIYYVRKGHDKNDDCIVTRTPIFVEEGLLVFKMAGNTETCSGKDCAHCKFKSTGGCECKNMGQGICSHTITRNRDLFRME